jgi:hypothetical protein
VYYGAVFVSKKEIRAQSGQGCSARSQIMPYGTDHDRFVNLFKSRSGQKLTRKEIIDIVQRAHPTLQRSSIMPSDHDDLGNK